MQNAHTATLAVFRKLQSVPRVHEIIKIVKYHKQFCL